MEQKNLDFFAPLPTATAKPDRVETSEPPATPVPPCAAPVPLCAAPVPLCAAPAALRHAVHFSSETDLWATPQAFYDKWNRVYGFELDVCALPHNAKCARYFTPQEDGLKQRWTGVCWMNPPYGREIGKWVQKAHQSAQDGATVVCLLPSRTDTRWWHSFVVQASEVHFIQGRLKFGDSKNSAPFPSAVVVFRPRTVLSGEKRLDSEEEIR